MPCIPAKLSLLKMIFERRLVRKPRELWKHTGLRKRRGLCASRQADICLISSDEEAGGVTPLVWSRWRGRERLSNACQPLPTLGETAAASVVGRLQDEQHVAWQHVSSSLGCSGGQCTGEAGWDNLVKTWFTSTLEVWQVKKFGSMKRLQWKPSKCYCIKVPKPQSYRNFLNIRASSFWHS